MNLFILTLFPEIFDSVFEKSIIKRARVQKKINLSYINIRDFGIGKHRQVDDKPYGGGEGMVMMTSPIVKALSTIKPKPYVVLLSASGDKFTQKKAQELSKRKTLAIICGHYEGVDARVESYCDETISIGDYVLTGGEIPSMLIVDAITRLIPGVINPDSPKLESYNDALLEYPQYTRPEVFNGLKVPNVLLSGDHAKINNWRKTASLKRTHDKRPDLLK